MNNHSANIISGKKAHNNNIVNLILTDIKKKKRKSKKPPQPQEEEKQPLPPLKLEDVSRVVRPSQFAPTNVITVNPAGAAQPTMFDVAKSQQLNAYENAKESVKSQVQDLRLSTAPLIDVYQSSGRPEVASKILDWLDGIEQSVINDDAPPEPPQELYQETASQSSRTYSPSDFTGFSSLSSGVSGQRYSEVAPSEVQDEVQVTELQGNNPIENSPRPDNNNFVMPISYEPKIAKEDFIKALLKKEQDKILKKMVQYVNKMPEDPEELLQYEEKVLTPLMEKYNNIKKEEEMITPVKKLEFTTPVSVKKEEGDEAQQQPMETPEESLYRKFRDDYTRVLDSFFVPEGAMSNYSSPEYKTAKSNLNKFMAKYGQVYRKVLNTEEDQNKLMKILARENIHKNSFMKLSDKLLAKLAGMKDIRDVFGLYE